MRIGTFIGVTCALAALGAATPAQAIECGSMTGTEGDDTLIIGEVYEWNAAIGAWWPVNPAFGVLGACLFSEVDTSLISTSCTGVNTSADYANIEMLGGDDAVTVQMSGIQACPESPYAIGPWWSGGWNNKFFLYGSLGEGADSFYGSPNRDIIVSNSMSFTDDGEDDLLCGFSGDDALYGDTDDTSDRECLDGGSGEDFCHGIGTSSPEQDRVIGCETYWSATTAPECFWNGWWVECYTCSDYCGASPPDLWP